MTADGVKHAIEGCRLTIDAVLAAFGCVEQCAGYVTRCVTIAYGRALWKKRAVHRVSPRSAFAVKPIVEGREGGAANPRMTLGGFLLVSTDLARCRVWFPVVGWCADALLTSLLTETVVPMLRDADHRRCPSAVVQTSTAPHFTRGSVPSRYRMGMSYWSLYTSTPYTQSRGLFPR